MGEIKSEKGVVTQTERQKDWIKTTRRQWITQILIFSSHETGMRLISESR